MQKVKDNQHISDRVARLFETHPEIKQVRVNAAERRLELAFHSELPPPGALERIDAAARAEFSGEWNIAVHTEINGTFHHHQIDAQTIEYHRKHPTREPPLIWRHVALPAWQNRPSKVEVEQDHRVMLLLAGICGVCTLTGFLLQKTAVPVWPIAALFTVAYFTGGWFAIQDVGRALRQGKIDVHLLMIVVATGALFVNAWTEGATLLFLFSFSNALEQFANHRTRKTIDSLLKSAPKKAFRREREAWAEIAIEDVGADDELLVKPGELFPVDGVLIEGETSADESALTGEALPVAKRLGDPINGGTLNLDGQAVMRATRAAEQSALQRILALIENAQQQKAPSQRFTDTFSRYYSGTVLALSVVVFVVLITLHKPAGEAFYRTMTLLVVASPCALVLSIPSAILVAIAAGAREGILFRGGVAIENLAAVNQFAFDKTGTLTKGTLRVSRIAPSDSRSEDEILALAASVGQLSTHPLSRAIADEARRRVLLTGEVSDFRNISGLGMEARVGGEKVVVGSRRLMEERGIVLAPTGSGTEAEVWIANSAALGVIFLSDEVRAESKAMIEQLKNDGAAVALISGDRLAAAAAIGAQVGIEDVRAEFSPEAKVECVHRWQAEGKKVAMVGDGINDAPSLTAADVAIAMGARGSDAALEQADVVLMHDRIENVANAVALSRRARNVIRQNIVVSLGVIVVLVISALAEKINLTLGVIGHEGSTVVVVLNGLRLLRFRTRTRSQTNL